MRNSYEPEATPRLMHSNRQSMDLVGVSVPVINLFEKRISRDTGLINCRREEMRVAEPFPR